MPGGCPEANSQEVDQTSFWDSDGLNWDQHRIGWAIAGGSAVLTLLISLVTVIQHCRNYTKPNEQRQILRILYMPPIYAIISFFSYRFFRDYTYYSLIQVVYEAFTISAFLLLIIEYVADTAVGHNAVQAIARKDKQKLPIPFCCWRYRPTKAYFMYTIKWSVMQYVVVRPAVSIAGIVCEKYNVLCESGNYSVHYAALYLDAVDFVSISIALYGLLLFYGLMKEELKGRRPLAKFLSIKLIVFFTFYQSFVFNFLKGRVIKGNEYWTPTNVADGLNALATCIEMIIFSALMMWAYTWNEYTVKDGVKTSIGRPLWDSINYSDFIMEIVGSVKFYVDYYRGKPDTHGQLALDGSARKADFGQAFGVSGYSSALGKDDEYGTSYDDDIRLRTVPVISATASGRSDRRGSTRKRCSGMAPRATVKVSCFSSIQDPLYVRLGRFSSIQDPLYVRLGRFLSMQSPLCARLGRSSSRQSPFLPLLSSLFSHHFHPCVPHLTTPECRTTGPLAQDAKIGILTAKFGPESHFRHAPRPATGHRTRTPSPSTIPPSASLAGSPHDAPSPKAAERGGGDSERLRLSEQQRVPRPVA